ncbi:MAG: hypothetical protein CMI53_04720 [Parcubacteria group bacterium]|nr:hypothetical protein [Parcubacteria group bacterium]
MLNTTQLGKEVYPMPTYRMIRCGTDYSFVIVVTPADTDPMSEDGTFYRYLREDDGDDPAVFYEIERLTAVGYFGGIYDGSRAFAPRKRFESLDAILEFIHGDDHSIRVKVTADEAGEVLVGYGYLQEAVIVYIVRAPDGKLRSRKNPEEKPSEKEISEWGGQLIVEGNHHKIVLDDGREVYDFQVHWDEVLEGEEEHV